MGNYRNINPYLALGVGLIVLAWGALLIRWADAPGLVTSFYRSSIASLVLVIPCLWMLRSDNIALGISNMRLAIWAGVFYGVDVGLHAVGVNLIGATIPTVLANTAPIWVGLGAMLFFGEKLGLGFWCGLTLAMIGAVMLMGIDQLHDLAQSIGSLYGLLAGVFYAAFFLLSQKARNNVDSFSFLCIAFASAGCTLGLISILFRQPIIGYSIQTYMIFVVYGAVVQVGGWLCVSYALGKISVSTIAPILLIQAVITGVLAHLFLGEHLNYMQYLGGATVLAGIFVVQRERRQRMNKVYDQQRR
jgi:drug/metabolite transporter (DMT)-like permease